MSEESTRNLQPPSFEERVLAQLSAIRSDVAALGGRISTLEERVVSLENKVVSLEERVVSLEERVVSLEEKVDRRLQETRPVWEGVQAQIRKLDTKFDIVIKELYEIRYDHVILGRRVAELEKASSQ